MKAKFMLLEQKRLTTLVVTFDSVRSRVRSTRRNIQAIL
jgi:hypothetical protein